MDLYRKNILLIIHQGSLGGAERQGLGMSKILTEGYKCKVDVLLTFSEELNKEFKDYAEACKVNEILYYGPTYLNFPKSFKLKELKRLKWTVEYLLRLRNNLKPKHYEIIIPFLNFPSKVAFYLYKLLPGVKFTFWHYLGLDRFNNDLFERIAIKNTPCIIANADDGLHVFRNHYKLNSEKLFVLPQYLSMELREADPIKIKRKYNIPENKVVIGMIAHYRPEKLQDLLLDTFLDLLKDFKDIHLIFLGNKEISNTADLKFKSIAEKIQEDNFSDNVSLLSGENVQEVLSAMDIGVLVSEIEGMPNSVMEYMLYSLPVVTTAHSGCRTLLGNSEFLIQNNPSDLKIALTKLLKSSELRKLEGELNAAKIKNFTKETYISKLQEIIDKTTRK